MARPLKSVNSGKLRYDFQSHRNTLFLNYIGAEAFKICKPKAAGWFSHVIALEITLLLHRKEVIHSEAPGE